MESVDDFLVLKFPWWLVILFLLGSCGEEIPVHLVPVRKEKQPLATVHGFRYLYTENGIRKAYLTAPLFYEFFEKESDGITWAEFGKGFTLFFYDSLGSKITSSVRADYGKLYERRTKALAKGNVIVTSEDGKRLETETLYWDREKDLLYTHDFVKITTPKEIIEGYGMEANTSFSWYKIYRLRGVFEIENAN